MLYKKDGQIYSRASAINHIINQLDSVVLPNYIDDDTLMLYGFFPDNTTSVNKTPTKEQRKTALTNVDWIVGATQISEKTKSAVESWRWLVRNLPEINPDADIPPLPKINKIEGYLTVDLLTEKEVETIKNCNCKDEGWLTFLQIWKDFGFTYSKETISNILTAYTNVTLDEVISSL